MSSHPPIVKARGLGAARTAPAWPLKPPPLTVIKKSNCPALSIACSASLASSL
jgi:hypothetical protein